MSEKISLKDLKDTSSLKNFVASNQYSHEKYCHYTTIKNIDSILNSSVFLLGSMTDVNDKEDCFGNDNLYSLCFAGTYSENIPLWYLYSGVDGKGGRLTFTKALFKKWLGVNEDGVVSIRPEVYKLINNRYVKNDDLLLSDNDYEILVGDVIYIIKEASKVRVKHNSNVNNSFPITEYDNLINEFMYFNKNISWFYEKEFRIVVRITNKELNKKLNQKNADNRLLFRLGFDIASVMPKIGLTLAPEFDKNNIDELLKKDGIKHFICEKIQLSTLSGQIKMKLLDKFCEDCDSKCSSQNCANRINKKSNS